VCTVRYGKVNVDLYSACREHTSKAPRCGTRSQGISQFYLHTPRSSADGINGWLEFAGLENDEVEQEQTYILHPTKNFNVYDM